MRNARLWEKLLGVNGTVVENVFKVLYAICWNF